jgi:ATP-binding cassette subfamily B protein
MIKKLSYELNKNEETNPKGGVVSVWVSLKEFSKFLDGDLLNLIYAFILIIINSAANVITPFIIAYALDNYINKGDISGLGKVLLWLLIMYIVTVIVGYGQGMMVGHISQRTLFRLRQALFEKLQDLPIAFFNQNKAGDLISRINNDTDKLNQFLSESIARFVGSFFSILGIAIFVLYINFKLGLVMLSSVLFLIIITRVLSPWIERQNKKNLTAVGLLSASLQENINNFRVIIAYNKREYFRSHLEEMNKTTFDTAFISGTANRVFEPIYDFAGSIALILVLSFGLYLVSGGSLTIGLLVAFVSYTQKFYDPLRILATIFGSIQLSVAAWSRIREIFALENNIQTNKKDEVSNIKDIDNKIILKLDDVSFKYEGGENVIENANLNFEIGKTYALVGPTGGGKSTLASIMSHLYEPSSGKVYLNGKPMSFYSNEERASMVSVILQDPILFSGTVLDNIKYGNKKIENLNEIEIENLLVDKGFKEVVERFSKGLKTEINQSGGGLSIGQNQLISFMRAVLREPNLLILDEATANIDTITEVILNKTLYSLPKHTTKIIIAHRLNTIKEADEIMFVNGHHVKPAGSFENAIKLIENSKRNS